jgi:hypothetical protein
MHSCIRTIKAHMAITFGLLQACKADDCDFKSTCDLFLTVQAMHVVAAPRPVQRPRRLHAPRVSPCIRSKISVGTSYGAHRGASTQGWGEITMECKSGRGGQWSSRVWLGCALQDALRGWSKRRGADCASGTEPGAQLSESEVDCSRTTDSRMRAITAIKIFLHDRRRP